MGINPAATGIKDFVFSIAFSHCPSNTPISWDLFYTASLLRPQQAACAGEELAEHQDPRESRINPKSAPSPASRGRKRPSEEKLLGRGEEALLHQAPHLRAQSSGRGSKDPHKDVCRCLLKHLGVVPSPPPSP